MLEELKGEVLESNLELVHRGVVIYTWGNVSGIDRDRGIMAIKPSGVSYDEMTLEDIVLVDLESGKAIEGQRRPSSDTQTHLELYRAFNGIGGITHTHSPNAVAFAQAGIALPALGTTHADYFYGDVPCTRELTSSEVDSGYEKNTGKVIIEHFFNHGLDPVAVPAALVRGHGPFSWGENAAQSVYHAVVLEVVAGMALGTLVLNPSAVLGKHVLDKHYKRKHGPAAYYGQV